MPRPLLAPTEAARIVRVVVVEPRLRDPPRHLASRLRLFLRGEGVFVNESSEISKSSGTAVTGAIEWKIGEPSRIDEVGVVAAAAGATIARAGGAVGSPGSATMFPAKYPDDILEEVLQESLSTVVFLRVLAG